jgi:hypothetical protein
MLRRRRRRAEEPLSETAVGDDPEEMSLTADAIGQALMIVLDTCPGNGRPSARFSSRSTLPHQVGPLSDLDGSLVAADDPVTPGWPGRAEYGRRGPAI